MKRVGRISFDKSWGITVHKNVFIQLYDEDNGGYHGTVTSVSKDTHKITCGLKISLISWDEGVIIAKTSFGPELTCKWVTT